MNQAEFEPLLQANYVLCADGVRAPQRFVEIFPIPAPKFGGTVIDVVKRPEGLDNSVKLAELPHVTTRVEWPDDIGAHRKPDLIRLMGSVAGNDVVPPLPRF